MNRKHGGTTKHGKSPTYCCWSDMRQRCLNSNNKWYSYYGGRGITVCEQWALFANFYADMGEKPEGLTLDRINNDGNYEPANCRWASRAEQRVNQRDCKYVESNGKRMTIGTLAKSMGVHRSTIDRRLLVSRIKELTAERDRLRDWIRNMGCGGQNESTPDL